MARGSLNRRPGSMAGWGVVTPSDVSRGVTDTIPGKLITYTLDWPELARLRGEELDMARDTAEKLYPLFHAGRGETPADRKALAAEVGLASKTTVDYHRATWEKAGRPAYVGAPVTLESPPESPAGVGEVRVLPGAQSADDFACSGHQVDLADSAAVATAQAAAAAAGVQTTVDGVVLLLGPGEDPPGVFSAGAGAQETEQQQDLAQQGSQGAAIDAGAAGEGIERTAGGTGAAPVIRCREEGCAHFRIADEQPGCAAPAMPPGQALGFKNNNWPETVDCPYVEPVLTAEPAEPGDPQYGGDLSETDPTGPGDMPATGEQPPKRDLDAMIAEALPRRRVQNHHPLPPPQAAPPPPPKAEERIPEKGQICEAQVARVEVDYVLVDLIEFYMPDSKRWIRGRIRAGELLRRGPRPDCTRTGLLSGDMVNVQVLDVQEPEWPGGRLRVELSSRLAPPHPKERHGVLEQGGQQYEQSRDYGRRQLLGGATGGGRESPQRSGEPITARGAEVAVAIQTPSVVDESRAQARELLRKWRLDRCHLEDLQQRIKATGLERTADELEADMAMMFDLKAEALGLVVPAPQDIEVSAAAREALERIASLEAELQEALNRGLQYFNDLAAAQLEREQARRAVADLVAQRDRALAAVVGLCETCVFRSSGFCPYPETVAEEIQVPDEDLNPNHKGKVVKFGQRPVVECELHRAEVRCAQT